MTLSQLNQSNLMDMMACAIVVLDHNMCITYMNQSAEMLFGQSLQRMRKVNITYLVQSEDFHQLLAQVIGMSGGPQAVREQILQLFDDQFITLDCIITPIHTPDTSELLPPDGLLLEMQRVDHQLRIVREKQILNQQQAAHELVRGISHEIKNPLGGIRGAAQLLESELNDPELREYTQIIISEADRLKNLVNSILGPGKLPRRESVNIHEVLEHVRQLVEIEGSAQLHFVRDYDPSIPEFEGDRGHMVQVCLNIVKNAVRAVKGEGTICLRTRVLRQFTIQKHRYRLVLRTDICDDGEGVPEHLQDKIFLPMVSGHTGGSGLGLAIAQALVRQYSGLIQCESVPGRTCFSILIPLEKGEGNDGNETG
ncbi:nitrogen regulation protein NR(II) [Thiolinea disciformis]|uniref:nitrogen regulation protein NR(II) n=1 Tax=Thiolinea disciformis TaxID=125614 RepID=UPI0003626BD8|nr:nitrogen regulation protein NR(II) [Thiolinea disciformis]